MAKNIVALIILDGFGWREQREGNAILASGIKNIEKLIEEYPMTTISASGLNVGLPDGQMGNSEVGHLNIGAGRIVYQELTRITKAIETKEFFHNEEFLEAIDNVKKNGTKLHLMGLISDGGVHSHLEHLYALLKLAKDNDVKEVYIHCFMDGRDVPPKSGYSYIEQLNEKINEIGCGKIATVMGRYYAMDRDNRWERVSKAYDALVLSEGKQANDALSAVKAAYDAGETDEFISPTVVHENGKAVATIGENDSVIFFNFRPDRAREISRAFIQKDFSEFPRKKGFFPLFYVSFTQYDKTFTNIHIAFKPHNLKNTLGEYLSANGKTQLRIAETEKYAHVTFFFNGGVEKPNEGEDRVLIPSPKVATYDLQPEMSACKVADEAVERIKSGKYDVMILNFANPDMVGHTGVMSAAVAAVTAVDECVNKVINAIIDMGGEAIVTADHGNAEMMKDKVSGQPFTAHTVSKVPFILVSKRFKDKKLRSDGILADIAPTMLDLMGIKVPEEMTGKTMIIK
ncbi:MAG: 2,3-bisphosphoglycerate-independent phosphoglycerate mutase [Eubacteriales bacterium]